MSDTRKGFNTTMGVVLALFIVFIVLPMATCVGCTMCTAGIGAVGQATAPPVAPITSEELGEAAKNTLEVSGAKYRILNENPFLHEVTYRFEVKNAAAYDQSLSFRVKFLDADGLIIDETRTEYLTIPTGGSQSFDGKSMLEPKKSALIKTMDITR